MVQRHARQGRPNAITIAGIITVIIGAVYLAMAAVFIPNPDLAIRYQAPILDDLGDDITREELILEALGGEIAGVIAGIIGVILGMGILHRMSWARIGSLIYNIIFILLSAAAFATSDALPDSYMAIGSILVVVILFRRTTKNYFKEPKVAI
jgi:lysylphosphatidylglycerol synthetase-like protein (DUF2156 family)